MQEVAIATATCTSIRRMLTLFLLLPSLAYANPSAERLQAIRHLAFSTCSNLLVYYNPQQADNDPRYLGRYLRDLQGLRQQVVLAQDEDLARAADDLNRHIAELQRQPASDSSLFPIWINPMLDAQARLDRLAATRYAEIQPEDPLRLGVHRLNLNIQRLQLLYQTRTFGGLAVYVMPVSERTFTELDQEILDGFLELERLLPAPATELAGLRHKYDFIRPRLLQHEQKWVPGGAAYYLGQVGDGLARLSELQALSDR